MKFSKILGGLCIALSVLTFHSALFSKAAEEAPEAQLSCPEYLVTQATPLTLQFEDLLNAFFLNSVASSDQVDTAMEMLRAYKTSIEEEYQKGLKFNGGVSISSKSDEFLSCTFYRDQYLNYAGALVQAQSLGSANSKRTYKIVDALKVTNEELRTFSDVFYETFPGSFQKMDNALPCYTSSCLQ